MALLWIESLFLWWENISLLLIWLFRLKLKYYILAFICGIFFKSFCTFTIQINFLYLNFALRNFWIFWCCVFSSLSFTLILKCLKIFSFNISIKLAEIPEFIFNLEIWFFNLILIFYNLAIRLSFETSTGFLWFT